MHSIIHSLDDIFHKYETLFVDLWGCVHDGYSPFNEAVEALKKYRSKGLGSVVLLTNSPRPRESVEKQLNKIGVPSDCWDTIATSGDSARAAMFKGVVTEKIFHIGPEHDLSFFNNMNLIKEACLIERVPAETAKGIVCTGPFNDANDHPNDYTELFLNFIKRKLKLLCANPDIVVDRGKTRVYCAGALAKLYTEMGGQSLYFGKPHKPIYDLAYERLKEINLEPSKEKILCVGDGILTDIKGAVNANLDSLFITGGLAARETDTTIQPNELNLKKFLQNQDYIPTHSIGHLR